MTSLRDWAESPFGSLLNRPFVRFLLVGGLNTAFGYGVFLLLSLAGLHYALALLIATMLGIAFNFKTIGRFVFRAGNGRAWRFVLVYGCTYAVNTAGIWLLKRLGLDMVVASASLVLPVAVLGFLLNRKFVFYDQAD